MDTRLAVRCLNKTLEVMEKEDLIVADRLHQYSAFEFIACASIIASGGLNYVSQLRSLETPVALEVRDDVVEAVVCVLVSHPQIVLSDTLPFTKQQLWEAWSTYTAESESAGQDIISMIEKIPEISSMQVPRPENSPLN